MMHKNSVLNKDNATSIGRMKIISFDGYIPHYAPSIPQQAILSKHNLSKVPIELQFVEGSSFF